MKPIAKILLAIAMTIVLLPANADDTSNAKPVSSTKLKKDVIIDTETTTTNKIMVHCDFGWQGYCNGYFTSGVFDLGSDEVLFDDKTDAGTKDTNYNWYLKMIRYNRP